MVVFGYIFGYISLPGNLPHHIFHSANNFFISEVQTFALSGHHTGLAAETVQCMVNKCVHTFYYARCPGSSVAKCRSTTNAGGRVTGDTNVAVDLLTCHPHGLRFCDRNGRLLLRDCQLICLGQRDLHDTQAQEKACRI